jgi:hypothetical protein
MRKKKLTESEIREYLTKNSKKYPNFSQFIKKDKYGAGIVAQVNQGTFSRDEIYTFWKKQKYGYTLEECIEVAKKCTTRSEMRANYSGYYDRVFHKRWNKQVFKYLPMSKKHKGYTFKDCKEIAKQCKHNNDMYQRFRGYHSKAERMGWLPKLFKKNYKNIGYTFRQCNAKARKCKNRKEFETNFPSHSARARREGWFNDICKHMKFFHRRMEKRLENNFYKLLKKNYTILYRDHYFKKYKSRPDFIIKHKNRIWIIELKADKAKWDKRRIKDQVHKYNLLGKALFKPFEQTIIVSPKGVYGISLQELIEQLK